MAGDEIHHPLFARFYRVFSHAIEREVGPRRGEVLSGLEGRVLEVGCGNGLNFAHYPATVTEVVAVEPESYLRAAAEEAAGTAPVPVTVQSGRAERLPVGDGTFDAAVASLVLCSVSDQARALAEVRRALRPGGQLRFLEHVRAEPGARKSRIQATLDRSGLWPSCNGGCHCSRDTLSAIEQAGFAVERVRHLDIGPSWAVTNPMILGAARRAE
jgi:SAM-dependent methyltransferase